LSPKANEELDEEQISKSISKVLGSPNKNEESKIEDVPHSDTEPSRIWDRNSKMPPGMMKRWFGGNP